jgi:hypothetical protein
MIFFPSVTNARPRIMHTRNRDPSTPTGELPIAMLACARIGAIHSVVFAGFSAESLAQRVQDCGWAGRRAWGGCGCG